MPATKNQTRRLEILDELLRQKRTKSELLQRLNEKNADFGKVDLRTLYRDINYLIDEKRAPIHRPEKGDNFYYYTEKFSLKEIPLDEDEVSLLRRAISILREVEAFELLDEVDAVIRKLERRIHTSPAQLPAIVQFEHHTPADGHKYFDDLFEAIQAKTAIRLSYQPFIHKTPLELVVHPYLLKEYRNRWFLLARIAGETKVSTFALDRIKKLRNSDVAFIENDLFDPDTYFSNVIGVTVPLGEEPVDIELKIDAQLAPYILSKPIHSSQELVKKHADGSLSAKIRLIINYELKSILLGYGPGIEVRKPQFLRAELKNLWRQGLARYKT